ncbi:GerAB/ArcD/ProY family transporter [Mesobacillus thioparans]|uniref:GerAB/ArcD/ProY family transporter n=1 Tax=Mesobacillus thioparans TaxID=370439 RepID=UPI0039EDFAA3
MDKTIQVVFVYWLINIGLLFFVYPEKIISSTDSGHWIPISIEIIIHLFALGLFLKGLSLSQNTDIITIYMSLGRKVSLIFSLPLTIYLMDALVLTSRAYAEITTIVFLANTPIWSITALLLSIPTYLAIKGIHTIFRTGMLIAIFFLPVSLIMMFVSFQNADIYQMFPISNSFEFIRSTSFYSSFFSIIVGFLFLGFIQPYVKFKEKKMFFSALFLIPIFFLSVYVPILALGQETSKRLLFPFVVQLDSIEISWFFFDRVTMFFMLFLYTYILLFFALLLWSIARICNQYFSKIRIPTFVIGISISAFGIALLIPGWDWINKLLWWGTPLRIYNIVIVPLSIFLLGKRRKRLHHEHI